MNIQLLILASVIPINLSLVLFVLLRGLKDKATLIFSLSVVFLCLWAFGDYLLLSAETKPGLELAYLLFIVSPLLAAYTTYLYVSEYSAKTRMRKVLRVIVTGITLGMVTVVTFSKELLIKSIDIRKTDLNVVGVETVGWALYAMCFVVLFGLSYIYLYKSVRSGVGRARYQLQYIAAGIFLTSLLPSFTNLVLPIAGTTSLIWVGPLFTIAYVITTSYAIVRLKLFDIRLYVVRAATYLLTLVVLSIAYIAPLMFLVSNYVLGYPFQFWPFVFAMVAASVVAFYYQSLRRWFDSKTAKVFFRDQYDTGQFISTLNSTIVKSLKVDELLEQASNIITNNLKSEFCTFVLVQSDGGLKTYPQDHNEQTNLKNILESFKKNYKLIHITDFLSPELKNSKSLLQENNIALVGFILNPEDSKSNVLGYVLLGSKKSGEQYNNKDVDAVSTAINSLTIAIQNALQLEQIKQFNATLQQKVDDATRHLRQSNEKLRALDESKDDFVSMASHQLRTPLTSVKGYLSMVLDGDAGTVNDQQRNMLKQAFISSQRMTFLIADLLNVSRLKTGKFIIEPMPTNLSQLVEQEVAQLHDTASSRNLKIEFDPPKTIPVLQLDQTKTRQVIMNFIDNAIYYTPDGGAIRVELIQKPKSVELLVSDNGIGIPKADQHHLFTKFYRAPNAKRARPDGTGLGLFMAKKVIVAQGGAVIFKSTEGKGSTFGFSFPIGQ